jgi:disulfide bond formation protein DsbB
MIDIFTRLNFRQWGGFFALVSCAVLIAVFISQYAFGLAPCKLCLWQRWPYGIVAVLGLLIMLSRKPQAALVLLSLIGITFLIGTGLAVFHVGVEQHWWTFASDCIGNAFKPGASTEDILAAIKSAPVVRCDEPAPFLFGLSMAVYNVLVSTGLTILAATAVFQSSRSNSLSQ